MAEPSTSGQAGDRKAIELPSNPEYSPFHLPFGMGTIFSVANHSQLLDSGPSRPQVISPKIVTQLSYLQILGIVLFISLRHGHHLLGS